MVESQRPSGSEPEVDAEGFLVQMDTWTREVAQMLARGEVEGELSQEHWKVVDYLRDYYLQFKNIPPDRMVAKDSGCTLERVNRLFPSGVVGGACRIAGIPRGAVCGKRYQCKRS